MNATRSGHAPGLPFRPRSAGAALALCAALVAGCASQAQHEIDILDTSEDALIAGGYQWISPDGVADPYADYAHQQCRKEIKDALTDQIPESAIPRAQVDACLKAKGWKFERPKK